MVTLPVDGSTVYVRLISTIDGAEQHIEFSFKRGKQVGVVSADE